MSMQRRTLNVIGIAQIDDLFISSGRAILRLDPDWTVQRGTGIVHEIALFPSATFTSPVKIQWGYSNTVTVGTTVAIDTLDPNRGSTHMTVSVDNTLGANFDVHGCAYIRAGRPWLWRPLPAARPFLRGDVTTQDKFVVVTNSTIGVGGYIVFSGHD